MGDAAGGRPWWWTEELSAERIRFQMAGWSLVALCGLGVVLLNLDTTEPLFWSGSLMFLSSAILVSMHAATRATIRREEDDGPGAR